MTRARPGPIDIRHEELDAILARAARAALTPPDVDTLRPAARGARPGSEPGASRGTAATGRRPPRVPSA